MTENETIREIREIRKSISGRFGHDPKRLVEYYMKKQRERKIQQVGVANSDSAPVVPPSAPSE